MTYRVGDRVRHVMHGEGVVCDVGGQESMYVAHIVNLELITPSAPTLSPDLIDRMVRLVRDLAATPVDPLVKRAREICREALNGRDIRDDAPMIQAVLRALRERS